MIKNQSSGAPIVAMIVLFLIANYTLLTPTIPSTAPSTQRSLLSDVPGSNPVDSIPTDPADNPACKQAVDNEEAASWALILLLNILMLAIFMVYFLLISSFRFIPESVAVIALSAAAGLFIRLSGKTLGEVVSFDPNTFFLYLLPPIIFESGYSLHKGNFFSNIGSIIIFAVFGTLISTVIVALGIYVVGVIGLSYPLSLLDSLIFGALISAVDPVATLAIFHALEVDPTLHMLVFGESVLNDAVAVVIYRTLLTFIHAPFTAASAGTACIDFLVISLGSIVIGVACALLSSLVFKFSSVSLYPSLEISLMFIFCYIPYLLAEGLELSGIMSILFCGIVMAHYTHFNLSAVSQLATQQTFRMLAFLAETSVFVYLGLAVFAFAHTFSLSMVIWSIILILVGRAANIFPLTRFVNKFRKHKIQKDHAFIMWFSGLRGAIAFGLALNVPSSDGSVMVTTTLSIVPLPPPHPHTSQLPTS